MAAEFSLGTAQLGTEVNLEGLEDGLDKAHGMADNGGQGIGSILGSGMKAGLVAAGGLLLGAIGGIIKGVSSNADFEMFEAQFASLMGSTDAAKAKIQELSQFAATTPFELPDVIKASKMLLTFGGAALNTEENLTMVGNAAAAAGQPVDQVAFWVGRAYNAIQNGQPFGEAAAELQTMGVMSGDARLALEKLQKEGATGPEVWAAFQKGLTAPSDAMEKLGKTWTGLMSTLSDVIDGMLRTITAPIFDALKSGLEPALAYLSGPDVQAAVQRFGEMVANGIGRAIAFFKDSLVPGIQTGVSVIRSAFGTLASVLGPIGGYFAAVVTDGDVLNDWLTHLPEPVQPVLLALGQLVTVIQGIIGQVAAGFAEGGISGGVTAFMDTLGQLSPAFALVRGAVEAAVPPIQAIVESVFGAVSGFVNERGGEVVSFVTSTWERVQGIVNQVLPPIQAVISTVFGAVASFISENQDSIQSVITMAWDTIKVVIDGALAVIEGVVIPVLSGVASFISQHGEEIKGILSGAWTIIRGLVETAMGVIQGVISTVTALIRGDWSGAWEGIKSIFSTVWEGIKTILSGALEVIKNLLSVAWDAIKGAASLAWEAVKAGVQTAIDGIKGLVSGLVSVGTDMVDGLVEGVKSAAGALLDAAIGVVKGAIDGAKEWLGIASPSKLARDDVGIWITAGITEGVIAGGGELVAAGIDVVGQAVGGMQQTVGIEGEDLRSRMQTMVDQLGGTIQQAGGGLVAAGADLMQQLAGTMGGAVAAEGSDLRSRMQQMVDQLGGVIEQNRGSVAAAGAGLVGDLASTMQLGIETVQPGIIEAGADLVQQLVGEMGMSVSAESGDLRSRMQGMVDQLGGVIDRSSGGLSAAGAGLMGDLMGGMTDSLTSASQEMLDALSSIMDEVGRTLEGGLAGGSGGSSGGFGGISFGGFELPALAGGTRSWPGGPAVVSEPWLGIEAVRMPGGQMGLLPPGIANLSRGAQVWPAGETRAAFARGMSAPLGAAAGARLANASTGGTTINQYFPAESDSASVRAHARQATEQALARTGQRAVIRQQTRR